MKEVPGKKRDLKVGRTRSVGRQIGPVQDYSEQMECFQETLLIPEEIRTGKGGNLWQKFSCGRHSVKAMSKIKTRSEYLGRRGDCRNVALVGKRE